MTKGTQEGDKVSLVFPFHPRLQSRANGAACIWAGPLLMALPIQAHWVSIPNPYEGLTLIENRVEEENSVGKLPEQIVAGISEIKRLFPYGFCRLRVCEFFRVPN